MRPEPPPYALNGWTAQGQLVHLGLWSFNVRLEEWVLEIPCKTGRRIAVATVDPVDCPQCFGIQQRLIDRFNTPTY